MADAAGRATGLHLNVARRGYALTEGILAAPACA
jgi:hypothetical protein